MAFGRFDLPRLLAILCRCIMSSPTKCVQYIVSEGLRTAWKGQSQASGERPAPGIIDLLSQHFLRLFLAFFTIP